LIYSGSGSSLLRSNISSRLLLFALLLWWGWACTDTVVAVVEVVRVTVEPASASLVPGESRQLQATPRDAQGNVLQGRSVQWSSSDPATVSVTPDGRVTALATGSATIRASSGDVQGTSEITVSDAPVISVQPDSVRLETVLGESTTAAASVTVTNAGGATLGGLGVEIEYGPGAAGWVSAVLSGSTAPATLQVTADAEGLSRGTWRATARVSSTSPGATTVALPIVLDVLERTPRPTITAVDPNGSAPGRSLAVLVTGSGFVDGLTSVSFGPGVVVDSVGVEAATSLTAYITVTPAAAAGIRDVTVMNPAPGGGTATLVDAFRVLGLNPAPTVASVQPSSGQRQSTMSVQVSGSGFLASATTVDFGPGIAVSSVNVSSPTSLTASITIDAAAALGPRAVTLVNPEPGGGTAELTDAFTVTAANPAPTLASVSPASGQRLQTMAVQLTGTNFAAGLTTIDFGSDINVAGVTVVNATTVTATISIGATAALGPRDVRVTNAGPGGGTATLADGFTITAANPAPSIQSIDPAQARLGQTVGIAISGSGFVPGVTTVSFGAGVNVGAVSVASPTALTVAVTPAADAVLGTRNVVVTNPEPGGGSASLPAGFRVVGAVSAEESSVTADPGSNIPANGTAASTITVVLRDAAESPISGLGPEAFEIVVTGSAVAGPIAENGRLGRYEFAVTNTVAQTITVTVKAEGVTLSPAPAVQFVPGAAARIAIVTQPSATAQSGAPFARQPVVRLLDASGNPVAEAGVQVQAAIKTGGGTLGGTTTVVSDTAGIATFTNLSITGTAGARTLEFTGTGLTAVTSQTIDITAGAATTLALNAGNNQSAAVGTAVPTAPSVKVTDASGNPVGGVSVTFAVASGGGSLGGSGSVSTNTSGVATSPTWTLGTAAGTNTLTATAAGLAGSPVTFTATATPASASRLVITTQPSSSAQSGAAFAQQPVIQLRDEFGNDVAQAGVNVTAAIASGGGSLGGNTTVATNASGMATFTNLSITGTVGARTLSFTSGSLTAATSQAIDITAGAATTLTLQDGDGQTAPAGAAVPVPPSVRVTDAAGNPVAGVSVTFAVASGGGSLAGSGTVATDGGGIATAPTWTLGPAAGTNTLTATSSGLTGSPVTFTATATVEATPVARIVTFGDSNTDYGYVSDSNFDIAARSYVSNRLSTRLSPTDPNHPNQLAGLIETRWADVEPSMITAVNHGIGGTNSGTGRVSSTTAPNALLSRNGVTRYEAEVLGKGYPWNGGETNTTEYPDGGISRVNAFSPGPTDFAYVSMGTNDPTVSLTPEQTLANLTWMVDAWLAEGHDAERFIITTLAPRGAGNGVTFPQINAGIRTLASSRGIKLIDLAVYTSDDDLTWRSADLHVGDEVHYTVAVRDWIAQQVVAHMRTILSATGILAGGN
jgi:hypothetical protein